MNYSKLKNEDHSLIDFFEKLQWIVLTTFAILKMNWILPCPMYVKYAIDDIGWPWIKLKIL